MCSPFFLELLRLDGTVEGFEGGALGKSLSAIVVANFHRYVLCLSCQAPLRWQRHISSCDSCGWPMLLCTCTRSELYMTYYDPMLLSSLTSPALSASVLPSNRSGWGSTEAWEVCVQTWQVFTNLAIWANIVPWQTGYVSKQIQSTTLFFWILCTT